MHIFLKDTSAIATVVKYIKKNYLTFDVNEEDMSIIAASSPTFRLSDPFRSSAVCWTGSSDSAGGALGSGFTNFSGSSLAVGLLQNIKK